MEICRDPTRLKISSICSDLRGDLKVQNSSIEVPEEVLKELSQSGHSVSLFGEGSCGEPQTAQHLTIDFTQGDQDNDFVQQKCCSFWEFVENHPEIHHMMAKPDCQLYASSPTTSNATTQPEDAFPDLEEEPVIKDPTAVSMLGFLSREGFIDKSFEAKIPQKSCSLGVREYLEDEGKYSKTPQKKKDKSAAQVNKNKKKSSDISIAAQKVKKMCEKMNKWDLNHPKSMEPIGPVPP